jgi:hypothetical protein
MLYHLYKITYFIYKHLNNIHIYYCRKFIINLIIKQLQHLYPYKYKTITSYLIKFIRNHILQETIFILPLFTTYKLFIY